MLHWQDRWVGYILLFLALAMLGCSGGGTGGGASSYTIQGVVMDSDGDPLPGVEVFALGSHGLAQETTNEDGRFAFSQLRGIVEIQADSPAPRRALPGSYQVQGSGPDLAFVLHDVQDKGADVEVPHHGVVVYGDVVLDFSEAQVAAGMTVRATDSGMNLPGTVTAVGPVVELQTSAAFAGEVTVRFAVDEPDAGDVFVYDPADEAWNVVASRKELDELIISREHFSVYGVLAAPRAEPPTASPLPGNYAVGTSVELAGDTIYYTLDGSQPHLDSFVYDPQNPLAVGDNGLTIKALAVKPNHRPSVPQRFIYTVGTVPTNLHRFREGQGYVREITERPFFIGDYVILEVLPNAGWEFAGWKEAVLDDLGDQRYGLYLEQETTLTSTFISNFPYHFQGFVPSDTFSPFRLVVDGAERIHVSDTNGDEIVTLDRQGTVLQRFGSHGTQPGQLWAPRGIDVDNSGNIYVAEEYNRRIQKFSPEGGYLEHWQLPSQEHHSGLDWVPMGVAVCDSGLVYAASNHLGVGQSAIHVFAAGSPQPVNTFANNVPFGLSSLTLGPDGNLYAAGSHEILVYTKTGEHIRSIGGRGDGAGEFDTLGDVAVSADGIIAASDVWNHRLQMFDSTGNFLTSWGTGAGVVQGPSRLSNPNGIAVDPDGDVVFVEMGRLKEIRRGF